MISVADIRAGACLLTVFAGLPSFAGRASPDLQTPALTPIALETPARHAPLVFARQGAPLFDIVIDNCGSTRDRGYREDVVQILTQSCARVFGSVPSLRKPGEPSSRVKLVVKDEGSDQAFTVASAVSGLTISGHALYGVVDFCERFLGVRWYFPGPNGWDAPRLKELKVGPVRYSDAPYFNRREASQYFVAASLSGEKQIARYAPYFGASAGRFAYQPLVRCWRLGGTLPYAGCHSPNPLALAKAYPDRLDVIFHRSPNGKLWYNPKDHIGNYYNVWNLEFADLLLGAWRRLETDGNAFPPGSFHGCTKTALTFGICDTALPFAETNGIENVYGRFFDYLSHRTQEAFPDRKLYLMCYANCAEPPTDGRCRLPSNVELMLCAGHMPSKITVPASVDHVRRRFQGWCDILGGRPVARLWLYAPGHNKFARAVVPELVGRVPKTFGRLLGREELFYDWWGSEDMWHFYYAAYVMYKSLWNPDFDVEAALDELFDRMYPTAAREMKAFHRLLVESHLRVGAPAAGFEARYPLKVVNRLERLLADAERKIAPDSVERIRFRLIADYWKEPFAQERGAVVRELPVCDALHAENGVDWDAAEPMRFINITDGTPVAENPPDVRFAWNGTALIGRAPTDWTVRILLAASSEAQPSEYAFADGSLRVPFAGLSGRPPLFHEAYFANVVAVRDGMTFGNALTRGDERNVKAYGVLRLGGTKLAPAPPRRETEGRAGEGLFAELQVTRNDPCGDRKAKLRLGNGLDTYEVGFNQYPKGHGVAPRLVFGETRVTERGPAPLNGRIIEFGAAGVSSLYMDFPAEENARYEAEGEIGWDFVFRADTTRVTLRYFVRKGESALRYALFAEDKTAKIFVRTQMRGQKSDVWARSCGAPVVGEFKGVMENGAPSKAWLNL